MLASCSSPVRIILFHAQLSILLAGKCGSLSDKALEGILQAVFGGRWRNRWWWESLFLTIRYFATISLPIQVASPVYPLSVNDIRGLPVSYLVALNVPDSQDFSELSENATDTVIPSCFCTRQAYGLQCACIIGVLCIFVACVCMFCVFMYVCMYVCASFLCIYLWDYACARVYVCVFVCVWACVCAHMYTCACIYPPWFCLNVSSSMEFSHLLQDSLHCQDHLFLCFFT